MSETATQPATVAPPPPPAPPVDDSRAIRPRRALPGGRAVVGAFLVVVAAVGTFGAYLQATAAPDTSYVVAVREFAIGHVLTEADLVGAGAGFEAVPMELPEGLAARAHTPSGSDVASLVGTVLVAPVQPGDLLLRSHVVPVGTAGAQGVSMSFSLPVDRALGGTVLPGERIDVLATYPDARGTGSETRVVARGLVVVQAGGAGEGLSGGRVTITVLVPDLATAQRVQNAVDVAAVAVVRGSDPTEATAPVVTEGAAPAPAAPPAGDAAPAPEDG